MPDAYQTHQVDVPIELYVDWWHEGMEQAVQETGQRGFCPAFSCMITGLLNPPFEGNA